jgi:ATP-dependent DNA ligase
MLMLKDSDLRARPLEMRKAMLADVLQSRCEPVRYSDQTIGTGIAFFRAVRDAGLEGVVAKRRASEYAGVLNNDWGKIKCMRAHELAA